MKQFSAVTYFSITDEEAFSAYVTERVKFWTGWFSQNGGDHNPVDMAISDAIQRPDLVVVTGITSHRSVDYNKILASHRAQIAAPEAFRAMFAGV